MGRTSQNKKIKSFIQQGRTGLTGYTKKSFSGKLFIPFILSIHV